MIKKIGKIKVIKLPITYIR